MPFFPDGVSIATRREVVLSLHVVAALIWPMILASTVEFSLSRLFVPDFEGWLGPILALPSSPPVPVPWSTLSDARGTAAPLDALLSPSWFACASFFPLSCDEQTEARSTTSLSCLGSGMGHSLPLFESKTLWSRADMLPLLTLNEVVGVELLWPA